ncbi:MAG: Sulfotransferase domain protein, partial [Xanthobacteraceae bacterium]
SSTTSTYTFSLNAGLIGMGRLCELTAVLYLENPEPDGADEELSRTAYFSVGTMKIERVAPAWSSADAQDPARLKPLLVSGLGRSGTTLLMKLLLSHPKIAGWGVHPYEGQAAQYWLNAARILLQPGDVRSDVPVTAFQQAMNKIYRNPFLSHPFMVERPDRNLVLEWADHVHVQQTIDFFKMQTDEYYNKVAIQSGKNAPSFFAEKTQPNMHSEGFWEFYSDVREITIVRHPFDVLCSVRALFSEVALYKTDEYIHALNLGYERMLARLELPERRNKVILYEDLISSQHDTMAHLFRFLDVDQVDFSTSLEIDANADSHMTSADPDSSVGRWKDDLSLQDQETAKAAFSASVKRLGRLSPRFDPGYDV